MKINLIPGCFILLALSLPAQSPVKWQSGFEQQKVFIENKSQFDGRLADLPPLGRIDDKILYGTDEGAGMIYFTKGGLIFRFDQTKPKMEEENDREVDNFKSYAEREREEHAVETITDVVQMEWENANPAVEIISLEPEKAYYSYTKNGTGINQVRAFKKLVYKNLYPGIDVVYVFHPKGGIEYSLTLHPGADISKVRMKYSDVNNVSIDLAGNLHLPTLFGDIIDHAPITAYESGEQAAIPSRFVKNGRSVSFELGNYDRNQTVIIDPWTATPVMPTTNKVYNIKSDAYGNAYLFGGESPERLQKYDSLGTLLWNYSTSWIGGNFSVGSLSTDRHGNCYISNGGGASVIKIDSAGNYIRAYNYPAGGPLDGPAPEFWTSDLNCSGTELYIGGSHHMLQFLSFSFSFQGTIFKLNLNTGVFSGDVNVVHSGFGLNIFNINEVRSLRTGPNGNVYFLTLDTAGSVSSNFNLLHAQTSGYHFPYYMPYSAGGDGQGQNNICATPQYMYSTDGLLIHKRDLQNGNILATDTIPFGTANNNSGIAYDSCGNVYVGSQNRVIKYDADLHLLSFASTPEPVYDLSVCANGDILACGHNYAVALDLGACGQYKPDCCTASAQISADNLSICSGDSVLICATAGMASYQWNMGQTTACIEAALAGNYYVTISDGGSCMAESNHLSLSVFPVPPVSISRNGDTLIAYNSDSYQWYFNGVEIPNATSDTYIAEQTGEYSVEVKDSNGCAAISIAVPISTGISDLAPGEELKVFPNPLQSGAWKMECGPNLLGSKVDVFDQPGRLVYSSEILNLKSEINLDVARGVYLMIIGSKQNKKIIKLIHL